MLDIRLLRQDPEGLRRALERKGAPVDLAPLIALDARVREAKAAAERAQHERKELSARVFRARQEGRGEEAAQLAAQAQALGETLRQAEAGQKPLEEELRALLLTLPNPPLPDVPAGLGAADNVVVREWGRPPAFSFAPKPHWELARDLGLVDFERGAKLAGSGFLLFTGAGARLCRALISFMLDLHTREHGFTEVLPPFLVNRAAMTGTGQLPKMEGELYRAERDDLFLIPTAEVPVTNIYRDEILAEEELPRRLCAWSACFRREAGSHGQEVRGMIRVHQFDKVELVKFTRPEDSPAELQSLVQAAETVLQRLELPYRVLELCAGDLSFAAARCYDLEAFAPGVNRHLEVSSCSTFTDFQARRANIRCRAKGKPVRFVHTLNGSGLALPRVIVALLECGQQADGSVALPAALRPYLGGEGILRRP